MMKCILLLMLCLPCAVLCGEHDKYQKVILKAGINQFDLNHDGEQDLVVYSLHDMNKSHVSEALNIYIHSHGRYFIVRSPGDDSLTLRSLTIASTAETMSGFIIAKRDDAFFLMTAKKLPINTYDPKPFLITVFQLTCGRDYPGEDVYRWQKMYDFKTKMEYRDANESLQEVLSGDANG